MRPSPGKVSWPRHSISRGSRDTTPTAPSTSLRTISWDSRQHRPSLTARATPAALLADSRFPSSTSTLMIPLRASKRRDCLIDLIGYRRHGHNEGDEPAFTQPTMYKKVASHPTVRELFARTLLAQGSITQEAADALVKKRFGVLEQIYASLKPEEEFVAPMSDPAPP